MMHARLTNGQKWMMAAEKRFASYCRARGWRYGGAFRITGEHTFRCAQYLAEVIDRAGTRGEIAFEMYADVCNLLDDAGRKTDLSAEAFDAHMQPFGLVRPEPVSKRQLTFGW